MTIVAFAFFSSSQFDEPAFTADPVLLKETQGRLRRIQAQFYSLPPPPGTQAHAARLFECSIDSEDLFQPSVSRKWSILSADAAAAARRIAKEMRKLGWQGDREPDRFGDYTLTFRQDNWSAEATVFINDFQSPFSVGIEAEINEAMPCRLKGEDSAYE
jgi:hypothetical protein